MIEGFPPSAIVVVNLVNPREKFFGILVSLSAAGVTIRGVNLDSFDDWIRRIARREGSELDLVTMFFPLFRVERIFLDEASGAIPSLAERFESVVGTTLREHVDASGR